MGSKEIMNFLIDWEIVNFRGLSTMEGVMQLVTTKLRIQPRLYEYVCMQYIPMCVYVCVLEFSLRLHD
jgi:hypothetical protein